MISLLRKDDIQPLRVCMVCYPFLHTPQAYIIRVSGYHTIFVYHPFRQERISLQKALAFASAFCMVGVKGFEPPTSCSQSRRATNCATPRIKPVPACGARKNLRLAAPDFFDRCASFLLASSATGSARKTNPKQARYQLRYTPIVRVRLSAPQSDGGRSARGAPLL